MALIICDECNREFSDTLSACPHCGKKRPKKHKKSVKVIVENSHEDPEANKETDGNPNEKKEIVVGLPTLPSIKKGVFIKIGIALIAIVVIIFVIRLFSGTATTKDEERAIANCEHLISNLKNPDSFNLYNDIEILYVYNARTDTLKYNFMYIDYGATNSYGGMERTLVSFDDAGYLGNVSETENIGRFFPRPRYAVYLKSISEREDFLTYGEDVIFTKYEYKTIPKDKIMKKLGL